MNYLSTLVVFTLLVAACQPAAPPQAEAEASPVRYTTDAPEIDAAKSGMDAYLAGDWEAFKAGYTEDAEIFHNSNEAANIDEAIETLQEGLQAVSSYGLADEQYWEKIIDDDGESWVYFWGTWTAQHASSDTQFEVPFHIAWLFKDGKVVEEYGLWDSSPMMLAEMEAGSSQ